MRCTRALFALTAAMLLAACASQENIRDAINAINQEFRQEYEDTLREKGTRILNVSPAEAFDAANAALVSLGMVVQQQSRGIGYLNAEAPAPLPLTRIEWDRASAADLPKAKEILRRHVGALAEFFHFEPEGIDIVINVTIVADGNGSAVSLTMRMRETAPPKSGLPRREYPPPTALRIGLDKIFTALAREVAARGGRS